MRPVTDVLSVAVRHVLASIPRVGSRPCRHPPTSRHYSHYYPHPHYHLPHPPNCHQLPQDCFPLTPLPHQQPHPHTLSLPREPDVLHLQKDRLVTIAAIPWTAPECLRCKSDCLISLNYVKLISHGFSMRNLAGVRSHSVINRVY